VSLLLQSGANANASRGRLTALHVAAWKGGKGIVALLLESGADIEAKDEVTH
jgi:ankyrin repeat protein